MEKMNRINDNIHFVTKFFHSLPHLNMWFVKSNSTFDPNNSDYLETILFWTTIPILTLIFLLLVLIIYACCLVCIGNSSTIKLHQQFNPKKVKLCKFKGFIWFFLIILSVLLGFLIFGSENFHYSFNTMTNHVKNFSSYFLRISNQTKNAQDSIMSHMNITLGKFEKDLRNSSYANKRTVNEALKELASIKNTLNDSYKSLEYLRYFDNERKAYFSFFQQIEMFEKTRWTIMLGIVVINMLLIILLIIGLIKNSKGSLCFFAFAGVLSLISVWILNAIYLGISVFIADFCTSPDQYITTVAEKNQIKNLVQYFTTCQIQPSYNKYNFGTGNKQIPFRQELNRAESKLRTAATLYNDNLVKISQSILGENLLRSYNFSDSLLVTENYIDSIRSLIKCDYTSQNYKMAVRVLCNNSIFSLGIILGSSVLFGFIMPVLICIIPQMWRRMHSKAYYSYNCGINANVDESHPFIPLNTGGGVGGGNGGSGNSNGQATRQGNQVSATRQFNESPSFQRLTNNAAANNIQSNTSFNSLSRNRYNNGTATLSHQNNYSSSMSTSNNNAYITATMSRNNHDEYSINTDPYLMYKRMPTAPPPQQQQLNNYMSTNYEANESCMDAHLSAQNAINVPIVLYPNSTSGRRTLSYSNRQNGMNTETLLRSQKGNYQMK